MEWVKNYIMASCLAWTNPEPDVIDCGCVSWPAAAGDEAAFSGTCTRTNLSSPPLFDPCGRTPRCPERAWWSKLELSLYSTCDVLGMASDIKAIGHISPVCIKMTVFVLQSCSMLFSAKTVSDESQYLIVKPLTRLVRPMQYVLSAASTVQGGAQLSFSKMTM